MAKIFAKALRQESPDRDRVMKWNVITLASYKYCCILLDLWAHFCYFGFKLIFGKARLFQKSERLKNVQKGFDFMRNKLSINRQKVKATTPISNLQAEMERTEDTAEAWDKKGRQIDTEKTGENIVLVPLPSNIDIYRKNLIQELNHERAKLSDGSKATRARSRALRRDTVDLITSVVQPSQEFIMSLPRSKQTQFFQECLDVIRENTETYGKILGAVIHYDENTPHMQVVCSTLDFEQLKARGNAMMGNQSKMSKDQTTFVEKVQEKGWQIERGLQRIDNPEYQNWASEKRAQGLEINRYTDELLMKAEQEAIERLTQANANISKQERYQADKFYRQFWQSAQRKIKNFSFNFTWADGKVEKATEDTVKNHRFGISQAFLLIDIGWKALQRQVERQMEHLAELKIKEKTDEILHSIKKTFGLGAKDVQEAHNLADMVSVLSRRSLSITQDEKRLETELEVFSKEVDKFEVIKQDFDELIDDLNPTSKYNNEIKDSLKALEAYDQAKEKEREWLDPEIYNEQEIWEDIESIYINNQFLPWLNKNENNPLAEVVELGFRHDTKASDGRLEERQPWTRQEIVNYLDKQLKEREKLKFDVSAIKKNIQTEKLKQSQRKNLNHSLGGGGMSL